VSDFLRIYDRAECDEDGVPLDWERCRTCAGDGGLTAYATDGGCPTCDGHGSLKAAALVELRGQQVDAELHRREHAEARRLGRSGLSGGQRTELWLRIGRERTTRCEGCGHPMSDGTWEGEWVTASVVEYGDNNGWALAHLRYERSEPPAEILGVPVCVHWSPCDEACTHTDGGLRARCDDGPWIDASYPTQGPERACRCGECKSCKVAERRFREKHGLPPRTPNVRRPAEVQMPVSEVDMAYLAGIFDGEGSIIRSRRSMECLQRSVQVGMTDREVVEWIGQIGGTVTERHPPGKRKTMWMWRMAAHNDVIAFLTALLPYLRVKKAEAEKALSEITVPENALTVEASWRAVDVRVGMMAKRAGLDPAACPLVARPFDLRRENVAILCLRCYADQPQQR
jgi:hypothetical protein